MGGKSRPHRNSISDRPARSQSLYQLSYRAHTHTHTHIYISDTIALNYTRVYIYIYIYTRTCVHSGLSYLINIQVCYVMQIPPDTDVFTSNACCPLRRFVVENSSGVQCYSVSHCWMVADVSKYRNASTLRARTGPLDSVLRCSETSVNIGTSSHTRKLESLVIPLWEPQISQFSSCPSFLYSGFFAACLKAAASFYWVH